MSESVYTHRLWYPYDEIKASGLRVTRFAHMPPCLVNFTMFVIPCIQITLVNNFLGLLVFRSPDLCGAVSGAQVPLPEAPGLMTCTRYSNYHILWPHGLPLQCLLLPLKPLRLVSVCRWNLGRWSL